MAVRAPAITSKAKRNRFGHISLEERERHRPEEAQRNTRLQSYAAVQCSHAAAARSRRPITPSTREDTAPNLQHATSRSVHNNATAAKTSKRTASASRPLTILAALLTFARPPLHQWRRGGRRKPPPVLPPYARVELQLCFMQGQVGGSDRTRRCERPAPVVERADPVYRRRREGPDESRTDVSEDEARHRSGPVPGLFHLGRRELRIKMITRSRSRRAVGSRAGRASIPSRASA